MELVQKMLAGSDLSLARLITLVERDAPEVPEIMGSIYPHLGNAYFVGFTGPPGGGKSTLVDRLTAVMRRRGFSVGIVACDPTSPFSGGAVLGDRIRMQQHYLDKGVFIRSMATRGSRGGLPRAARGVIKLLDAFGKDFVLVETVGVGQTELDIMEAADTTVVILVPEAGDTIQTMKAGLLEIADIFVVNKADRERADYLVMELEQMLRMSPRESWRQAPVLTTQAINDIGTEELYQEIERHREVLRDTGRLSLRRQEQRKGEFIQTIEQGIRARLLELVERDGRLMASLERVERGEVDPYSASMEILTNKTLLQTWLVELERER
ncbi:MAG: methylmalonyl Co-A mutase-associated GTPase MeaB [Dehalococcoidia bacterium]|nr:MAG: methylmalonyl Co-A mutase-associated GTPase MeaB [Dehalococcoidia bacterium]